MAGAGESSMLMPTGDAAKTPVTILTGFLGAGKTTLLNYIIKNRGSRNISVIENEFGEVNIDSRLVADNLLETEDLVSLDNGCVCCSLRKDVVKALAELERRSRQREKRVDQVILETTGLADPAPVAFTFFANPWIASRYRIDSIVCVCDTQYALQHLDPASARDAPGVANEAAQQLAFADVILLNKIDLVNEAQLERVRRIVRDINQSARQIECRLNQEGGRPQLSDLLDTNAFSVHKALKVDPYFLEIDNGAEDPPADGGAGGGGCQQADPSHREGRGGAEARAEGGTGFTLTDAARRSTMAAAVAAQQQQHKQDQQQRKLRQQQQRAASPSAPAPRRGDEEQECSSAATFTQLPSAHAAAIAGADDGTPAEVATPAAAAGQEQQQQRCKRAAQGNASAAGDAGAPAGQEVDRASKRRRKHLHDLADIGSVGIVAHGALDEYRFNMFMRDLLTEKGKDIYRCKGVLAVHGYGTQRFVFQGVHETICYGPGERPWAEDEPRVNHIVFIGRGLDRKALMMGFRTCVWKPLPDGWREAFDPVTSQPYYYNPSTHEKTWARPQRSTGARAGRQAPAAAEEQQPVSATPVVPAHPPRRPLPARRRSFGLPAHAGQAAAAAAAAAAARLSCPEGRAGTCETVRGGSPTSDFDL